MLVAENNGTSAFSTAAYNGGVTEVSAHGPNDFSFVSFAALGGVEHAMDRQVELVTEGNSPALFIGLDAYKEADGQWPRGCVMSVVSPSGHETILRDNQVFDRPEKGRWRVRIKVPAGMRFRATIASFPSRDVMATVAAAFGKREAIRMLEWFTDEELARIDEKHAETGAMSWEGLAAAAIIAGMAVGACGSLVYEGSPVARAIMSVVNASPAHVVVWLKKSEGIDNFGDFCMHLCAFGELCRDTENA